MVRPRQQHAVRNVGAGGAVMRAVEARRWAASTAVAGTVFIAAGAFWLSFTSLADLAARSGIGAGLGGSVGGAHGRGDLAITQARRLCRSAQSIERVTR